MDLPLRVTTSLFLLLASLRLFVEAAECSLEHREPRYDAHHFVCSNYYESLMASLQRDGNELYWLEALFFPPSKSVPHTLHLIATIHVENIGLPNKTWPANCSRDAPPAFLREGAFWVREWQMSISSSPVTSFASMDLLFALDSTLTWAVYVMATGLELGSAVSEGGNVRFFIDSLPCMPSLEVMTEVLEKIMSEIKSIARHHGKPRKVEEVDMMVVSSMYAIVPDGDDIILTEPQEIGTKLLLSAFGMIQLLGMFTVAFLLVGYHKSLREKIQNDEHSARSIYNSVVFLSLCFLVLRVGVTVIAGLSESQFDISIPRDVWALTLSTVFTIVAPVVETIVALIVILLERRKENNEKENDEKENDEKENNKKVNVCGIICGITRELPALFIIFAFFHYMLAAILPISVLMAMFPGEVISSVALISSSTLCIATFMAHIFHLDSPSRRSSSSKFKTIKSGVKVVLQAISLVLFTGLLCVVFVFYLLLLSRGLDDAGLVGFVLSLIPSLILSYTSKLIGKKLLHEQTN